MGLTSWLLHLPRACWRSWHQQNLTICKNQTPRFPFPPLLCLEIQAMNTQTGLETKSRPGRVFWAHNVNGSCDCKTATSCSLKGPILLQHLLQKASGDINLLRSTKPTWTKQENSDAPFSNSSRTLVHCSMTWTKPHMKTDLFKSNVYSFTAPPAFPNRGVILR